MRKAAVEKQQESPQWARTFRCRVIKPETDIAILRKISGGMQAKHRTVQSMTFAQAIDYFYQMAKVVGIGINMGFDCFVLQWYWNRLHWDGIGMGWQWNGWHWHGMGMVGIGMGWVWLALALGWVWLALAWDGYGWHWHGMGKLGIDMGCIGMGLKWLALALALTYNLLALKWHWIWWHCHGIGMYTSATARISFFSQADMQAKRVENPLTYGGKTDMLRETYQNTGRTKMTDSDMVCVCLFSVTLFIHCIIVHALLLALGLKG